MVFKVPCKTKYFRNTSDATRSGKWYSYGLDEEWNFNLVLEESKLLNSEEGEEGNLRCAYVCVLGSPHEQRTTGYVGGDWAHEQLSGAEVWVGGK